MNYRTLRQLLGGMIKGGRSSSLAAIAMSATVAMALSSTIQPAAAQFIERSDDASTPRSDLDVGSTRGPWLIAQFTAEPDTSQSTSTPPRTSSLLLAQFAPVASSGAPHSSEGQTTMLLSPVLNRSMSAPSVNSQPAQLLTVQDERPRSQLTGPGSLNADTALLEPRERVDSVEGQGENAVD